MPSSLAKEPKVPNERKDLCSNLNLFCYYSSTLPSILDHKDYRGYILTRL